MVTCETLTGWARDWSARNAMSTLLLPLRCCSHPHTLTHAQLLTRAVCHECPTTQPTARRAAAKWPGHWVSLSSARRRRRRHDAAANTNTLAHRWQMNRSRTPHADRLLRECVVRNPPSGWDVLGRTAETRTLWSAANRNGRTIRERVHTDTPAVTPALGASTSERECASADDDGGDEPEQPQPTKRPAAGRDARRSTCDVELMAAQARLVRSSVVAWLAVAAAATVG